MNWRNDSLTLSFSFNLEGRTKVKDWEEFNESSQGELKNSTRHSKMLLHLTKTTPCAACMFCLHIMSNEVLFPSLAAVWTFEFVLLFSERGPRCWTWVRSIVCQFSQVAVGRQNGSGWIKRVDYRSAGLHSIQSVNPQTDSLLSFKSQLLI